MISAFRPRVTKKGSSDAWYEAFRGSSSLSVEQVRFLDLYSDDEFNDDFTLIFYDELISSKEPVTIKMACEMMMEL